MMSNNETKVMENDFKGTPMFSIFEFDKEGNKNFKPLVNMGMKKAKLVLKHVEELKKYVQENEK